MVKVFFRKPSGDTEKRTTLIPAMVAKYTALGASVVVEAGLGEGAMHADQAYADAGADVVACSSEARHRALGEADVVVTVEPLPTEEAAMLKRGATVVGMLAPMTHAEQTRALVDAGATVMAMEFLPRISRAQSMDVLSSQASIAGYKAVLMAADLSTKMLPMMMTAAGTLSPSKVFVIGAGVAGLQAIATAKRLGAIVEAFDVRAATKEQIQSLGARFVEIKTGTASDAETKGGYARELTDEERQKQQELMSKHVIGADIVITTAAVFGKAPPMLIASAVVEKMSRGAILVDLAASAEHGRGNCEATRPGQTYTTDNGVTIVGVLNVPALVATHASQALANNVYALLAEVLKNGQIQFNLADEVQKGVVIAHEGQIRNNLVRQAVLAPVA